MKKYIIFFIVLALGALGYLYFNNNETSYKPVLLVNDTEKGEDNTQVLDGKRLGGEYTKYNGKIYKYKGKVSTCLDPGACSAGEQILDWVDTETFVVVNAELDLLKDKNGFYIGKDPITSLKSESGEIIDLETISRIRIQGEISQFYNDKNALFCGSFNNRKDNGIIGISKIAGPEFVSGENLNGKYRVMNDVVYHGCTPLEGESYSSNFTTFSLGYKQPASFYLIGISDNGLYVYGEKVSIDELFLGSPKSVRYSGSRHQKKLAEELALGLINTAIENNMEGNITQELKQIPEILNQIEQTTDL